MHIISIQNQLIFHKITSYKNSFIINYSFKLIQYSIAATNIFDTFLFLLIYFVMNIFLFVKSIFEIIFEVTSLLVFAIYILGGKLFRLFIPRSLKSLDGEIILITGTGNGIGQQLALQLADVAPKSKIICWDIESKSNEKTVAQIKKKNVVVYSYQVDVSDREMVSKFATKVRNEVGDVTIIINNAGICHSGPFLLQKPESLVKTFQVNLFGQFWILQEFLPSMIRHNHGHIVTMASILSTTAAWDLACYSSSKQALHGFIDALKREVHNHTSKTNNVHFTTVYPVIVQTRLSGQVKLTPRFPVLFPPSITPQYVAEKTIEGFRQNYEYLYLPPMAKVIALFGPINPFEIQQKLENGLMSCEAEHLLLNEESIKDYHRLGTTGNDKATTEDSKKALN